jgi:uncharacterized protein (TIGR00730 family)
MSAKSICVFAASSLGADQQALAAARELGAELAARDYGLVYGGAHVGLMGLVADAVLNAGGEVVGVMPDFLVAKEIAHTGLTELIITKSMHERKDAMARRATSGFIALPGALGTMEELFEVLTWAQLGLHSKPCGLLNVNGYYDSLLTFLDTAVNRQLLAAKNRSLLLAATNPRALLDEMEAYVPPATPKWITPERT